MTTGRFIGLRVCDVEHISMKVDIFTLEAESSFTINPIHALEEMDEDGLTDADVLEAILEGRVAAKLTDSRAVFGW